MSFRPPTLDQQEHRPARSGTQSAWMALFLLAVVIGSVFFFKQLTCGLLRLGLNGLAWSQRATISMDQLALSPDGTIQARGVVLKFGLKHHLSYWKCDSVEVRLAGLPFWLGLSKGHHGIRELSLGKSKVFIDQRGDDGMNAVRKSPARDFVPIPWISLLPDAMEVRLLDLVIFGKTSRLSMEGLHAMLPNGWQGRVSYSEILLDFGDAHQRFAQASAPASWDGVTLRVGKLKLEKGLKLYELSFTPHRGQLDFGLRGSLGGGLVRGDGAIAIRENDIAFATTIVGENLGMDALSPFMKEENQHMGGTIRQGRFSFRGDLGHPLEADSSLRLVADNFRWEGRGWDTLRLAATLTGRTLTLSELVLHQQENEVVAQGESKLPEDWQSALKAPFTASFHAQLNDAGALSALLDPRVAQLSGELELQGVLQGSDNKATGYCNLASSGMKIRNLPIDRLKGCLLFEKEKTRLSNLEAWSGKDHIVMDGTIENQQPYTYSSKAEFGIANLTKSLAQIGISTAAQFGGGAVAGSWSGDGSAKGHSGTFQAKLTEWISPWTTAGMSGTFEGSYSPGRLYCSKAEFQAEKIQLGLQLIASPTRLEAKSITATRKGKTAPLVQGEISLPLNAPAFWQKGDLIANLIMNDPLTLQLNLHGIKVEELANLFGQPAPCTGMLEGKLIAAGTPSNPEIHSALTAENLALPRVTTSVGMICAFDSIAGRATCLVVQSPIKKSPLTLEADFPFRLIADQGALRFADRKAMIQGKASLHNASIKGWLGLWEGSERLLDNGSLDGVLTLGGTMEQPAVEGNLILQANEISLPGLPPLSKLNLPISCAMTKATATAGEAWYGTNPIALSGVADWSSNEWRAQLNLSGKNLSFPTIAKMKSVGDAELSVKFQGTNAPMLTGKLMINHLDGSLPTSATLSFDPPGMNLLQEGLLADAEIQTLPARLDLQIQTGQFLSISASADSAQVQTTLYLVGDTAQPSWEGVIKARNIMLNLPAGGFVIPEALLTRAHGGRITQDFTAYGMTQLGYCTMEQRHELSNLIIEPASSAFDHPAADLLLSLATPTFAQMPSWVRQSTLFPDSTTAWMERRIGVNAPESLGFYGRSWSLSFHHQIDQEPPSRPTLPKHKDSSKN